MKCAACCTCIVGENALHCTIEKCNKIYHLLCAGGTNPINECSTAWVCPECRCAAKRGGDNSLTPVGTSKKSRDTNVTYRKKLPTGSPRDEPQLNKEGDIFAVEMRTLRQEMATLRQLLEHSMSIIKANDAELKHHGFQMENLQTKLLQYEAANAALATHLKNYVAQVEKNASNIMQPVASGSALTAEAQQRLPASPPHSKGDTVIVTDAPKQNKQRRATKPSSQAVSAKSEPKAKPDHPSPSKPPQKSGSVVEMPLAATVSGVRETRVLSQPDHEAQPWTEVRRKNRRLTFICGTAGPAVTSLKAVEFRKYLHLWNMESSADEIRDYLRLICPNTTATVEVLTPKGSYKSYKIGIPEAYYETCFSKDMWPINARINAWVTFRKPAGPMLSVQNNQPFQSAVGATSAS